MRLSTFPIPCHRYVLCLIKSVIHVDGPVTAEHVESIEDLKSKDTFPHEPAARSTDTPSGPAFMVMSPYVSRLAAHSQPAWLNTGPFADPAFLRHAT